MELLNFIFRLGVVFAIFGFIWGLINIGITLLTAGRQRHTAEVYILKAVQYVLLVNVTFLICYDNEITKLNDRSQLIFGAITLLMYFMGKFQRKQRKQQLFQFYANGNLFSNNSFNYKAEIGVIIFAIFMFILFWFQPQLASNPISLWFQSSILDIEDTPIFGFVFKVIGFFFLMSILFKLWGTILFFLSGQAFKKSTNYSDQQDNNRFDDFEELN